MKKVLMLLVCLLPLTILAADDWHQVFLNGKPLGKATLINGVVAISLEDLARAGGSSLTLEPMFKLQGSNLNAAFARSGEHIKKTAPTEQISLNYQKVQVEYKEQTAQKVQPAYKEQTAQKVAPSDMKIVKVVDKSSSSLMFKVNKPGAISSNVLMQGGKAFVPLSDVAKAFGGVWTQPAAGLAPGQGIQLNFASNPNAILIGL